MGGNSFNSEPLDKAFAELEKALAEVRAMQRAIDGDPVEGWPGLRQRIKNVELALDEEREERVRMQWRLAVATGALKWLGPSGVILILGFIGYVIRTAGQGG